MIYFIYLASGNSSRFGDDNKLLQNFNEKPLFQHGMDTLHTVSLNYEDVKIITVTKYLQIAQYAKEKDICAVYKKEMPNEISYTIKLGINAIPMLKQSDYLVFLVSDQPLISKETIKAFISHAKGDLLTACAYYGEIKGNPVMFSAKLHSKLMALSGDVGGKSILKLHPPIKIEVQNEKELKDVDDMRDLAKLQAIL